MGNRNGSTSSMSYNSPSRIQRPSSASSFRSASARYRSDRARSGSSLSNDSYPVSTLNKLNSMEDSPLINKLRQKVASRVMGFNKSGTSSSDTSQNLCTSSSHDNNNKKVDSNSMSKLRSQSSLTNDQLTAHLTDEERLILQKVFQKEEEFHRESLLKRQTKGGNDERGKRSDGSPLESPSTNDSKRVGDCRTCRKKILVDERYNYCDTCAEPICDDCSSYSDKSEQKLWMCSFCRRRGTQPAVAALTELGLMIPSSLVTGRRRSTIVSMQEQVTASQRRPSSVSEVQRQNSNDSSVLLNEPRSASRVGSVRRLSARPDVPVRRYSANVFKERYSSADGLDENRPASESSNVNMVANSLHGSNSMRSREDLAGRKMARKSFSASDSSLEDFIMGNENQEMGVNGSHLKRQRSRRSKSVHQHEPQNHSRSGVSSGNGKPLLEAEDYELNPNLFGRERERKSSNFYIGPGYDSNTLRHIASDVALYSISDNFRRKSDSQSSDFSDIRISSPPNESMSPSSPDISKSPRESADSEMLGLPSIGALPTQRRSIPSVLVDNAVDGHHLTLKDCFPRRSSTGRALPRIPCEQSRSLLELPQGRTHSTHSLDLPNSDQPRRASAPEGENITIVIDDVDSVGGKGKNTHIERIILHRDENDTSSRTFGFGLVVMGGKISETDGKLYAYVAYVVPGGPAEKMSLRAGDKILEWDRKSLVNCTYEQVCAIIESSKTTAEVIFEPYSRGERRGALVHQRRRLSQGFSQSGSEIFTGSATSPSSVSQMTMANRRKLPKPPGNLVTENQGEILIQAWIDVERNELVVTILCAKGIHYNSTNLCFVRVRVFPELGFSCCQTEFSDGLEWNETVLFQNFPIDKMNEMALEISIWEGVSENAKLLGETVIPLESAVAHNTDWWPLLSPATSYYLNRSTSLDTLAVKNHQHPSCLSESRSVPTSRRNSGRSDIIEPPSIHQSRKSMDNIDGSIPRSLGVRQNSVDKVTKQLPINLSNNLNVDGSISPRRKSATAIMSRSPGEQTNHQASTGPLPTHSRDPINAQDSDSSSENLTSESDSINANALVDLAYENGQGAIVGELKLGFIMTKGLLEVEVIAARGLAEIRGQPPNTYVKTYLNEGSRHTNKKKTRVVYSSCNPQYKQTLKYDAALIYGRSLFVMVWHKLKGFEHNTPIGAVDIKVNQLELHKLTISWYKLFAPPKS